MPQVLAETNALKDHMFTLDLSGFLQIKFQNIWVKNIKKLQNLQESKPP